MSEQYDDAPESENAAQAKWEPERSGLKQALFKKALGYDKQEIHEEYIRNDDGEMQLVKRKITDKHHAPDPTAAKMLMDDEPVVNRFVFMTFQELEDEKERLLKELNKDETETKN